VDNLIFSDRYFREDIDAIRSMLDSEDSYRKWLRNNKKLKNIMMKKLTKKQLREIAVRHSAGVLLATEAVIAFDGAGLSDDEMRYIDTQIEDVALKLLRDKEPLYNPIDIVNQLRRGNL
jgi:hypothetical protein